MRTGHIRLSLLVLAASGAVACASAPKPKAIETAPLGTPARAPATTQPPAAAPRAPDAISTGLTFTVEPGEAEVAVDGRVYGTVAELSDGRGFLPLPPGIYQVSLRASGFVTWRAEVAVRSSTEPIRVKLARKP